jgi:aryl-alcohol dehydrogenase-like predicted oxidoreductase
MLNKIILGAANFNKKYGLINNNLLNDSEKVLAFAQKKKIKTIDFAPKYIADKKTLKLIADARFKVISKLPSIKKISKIKLRKFIDLEIKKNLSIFKTDFIFCILFHDSKDFKLKKIREAIKILLEYKKKKIIRKLGVSVYNPEEINLILNNFKPYKPDIIQLPFNIFDNRFEKTGMLKKLKKLKILVHARSIFLQGLVFKNTRNLSKYFNKWKKKINNFNENKSDQAIYNICFNYVYKNKFIDGIIIGFKFEEEITKFFNSIKKLNKRILKEIKPINDEKFVNPSNWRK